MDYIKLSKNVMVYIDDTDAPLKEHRWTAKFNKGGSFENGVRVDPQRGYVYLHRAIMERVLGRRLHNYERVAARDKDRTNCRRENLLLISREAEGRPLPVGVYRVDGYSKPFRAAIYKGGRVVHLGVFDTVSEAERAYLQARLERE